MKLRPVRRFSNYVTLTSIDRAQAPATTAGKLRPSNACKLRVPLLKSPSHLGHASSRGNRMYNEDRYSAGVLQLDLRTIFNFGIYDGHGGEQCLLYLLGRLGPAVEAARPDPETQTRLYKDYAQNVGGYWRRWYKHKDQNLERMQQVPRVERLAHIAVPADDFPLRLPSAFLQTDYDFLGQDDNRLGSTCTSVFLETIFAELRGDFAPVFESHFFNRRTITKLTVAHVGDTKAILVDRFGEAHALTVPHHPLNPVELARLRRYLANFFMTDSFGEERFISLANTRAFGDVNYKEVGVTAEPEVAQYLLGDAETMARHLTPAEIRDHLVSGLGGDEAFLVLCTDGVSNELTDQEIADIVMVNFNMRGHQKASPQFCAEEVVKFVEYIGGDDNALCMVVRLNGWGKWPLKDRTGQLRQERLSDFSPRDRG